MITLDTAFGNPVGGTGGRKFVTHTQIASELSIASEHAERKWVEPPMF